MVYIKKNLIRIMTIILSVIALFFLIVFLFMRQPKFGENPTGKRLERIQKSPNFKEGNFQNLNKTPQMTGDKGFFGMMNDYFSAKNKKPGSAIPSIKTDLKN